MASRKENLKALFSNTRSRVIILFTIVLMVLAVVIGYFKLSSNSALSLGSGSVATGPGVIQSIPGALDQTAQYAKLQEEQNRTQAIKAVTRGGSAIPTIIRTKALGEGVGVVTAKGITGVGFATLQRENEGGVQKTLWVQALKDANCSKSAVQKVVSQGAQLSELKEGCTCVQLKDNGYSLQELQQVCECKELKAAGFNARQLKNIGFGSQKLLICGFSACEQRAAGFTAAEMKDAGFTDGELKGSGFSEEEINKAGGLPNGITADKVREAGCSVEGLMKLRKSGVTAAAIRRIGACSAAQLRAAGYSAKDLKSAGFQAAELKNAGFSPAELKDAGFSAKDLANAGYSAEELAKAGFSPEQIKAALVDVARKGDCSVESLKKARLAGISALTIRQTLGCSAEAMKKAGYTSKELKEAGFTAAELKAAGFSAGDLKNAGFSPKELRDAGFSAAELKSAGFGPAELKNAGFSAKDLKAAGFSAADLKNAGFSPKDLKDAGFSAAELKNAGFSVRDLKDAGFSPTDLKNAGFSAKDLKDAGFSAADLKGAGFSAKDLKQAGFSTADLQNLGFADEETQIAGLAQRAGPTLPSIGGAPGAQTDAQASSAMQLQAILNKQNEQMAEQKYQQKIQQRTSEMMGAANQSLQEWKKVTTQVYTEGNQDEKKGAGSGSQLAGAPTNNQQQASEVGGEGNKAKSAIKTGDILFAVLDTSVNSDEPGPILATIVSGKLKGSKLIGSFNLPSNANKMIITFNTLSVPGLEKTISVSAVAIDPNTARTALSSNTNHHYMMRYGSLFAATFLQGFGNAILTTNTTITIGGTGGGNNISVASTAGQSTLQQAVIGLATVGKAWAQQAQQIVNTPTTVQVYSGTGMGILFTQDVEIS